jgi:hypothetical protein
MNCGITAEIATATSARHKEQHAMTKKEMYTLVPGDAVKVIRSDKRTTALVVAVFPGRQLAIVQDPETRDEFSLFCWDIHKE